LEQVTVVVEIPRGIPAINGKWIRKATIRHINGHDEQSMLEMSQLIPLHQRILFLLERIVRFDDVQDIYTGEALKKISIGDRVALLFHTRRMIFGDFISCTITCVNCNKKMSLQLDVLDLLQAHYPDQKDLYGLEAGGFNMKIKPLNAFDQDNALVAENLASPNSLGEKLAKSCIAYSNPELPSIIPKAVMDGLGSKLEEIDPLSDIVLGVSCPECGQAFQALFPAEEFIFKEFAMLFGQLEREVHWLAFNYCWSQNEILDLPVKKRKKYIELINATLSGESM
jgi:hypothetical protein